MRGRRSLAAGGKARPPAHGFSAWTFRSEVMPDPAAHAAAWARPMHLQHAEADGASSFTDVDVEEPLGHVDFRGLAGEVLAEVESHRVPRSLAQRARLARHFAAPTVQIDGAIGPAERLRLKAERALLSKILALLSEALLCQRRAAHPAIYHQQQQQQQQLWYAAAASSYGMQQLHGQTWGHALRVQGAWASELPRLEISLEGGPALCPPTLGHALHR